jgi:hypothetical protein
MAKGYVGPQYLSRESIKHGCKIDKPPLKPNKREVRYPDLVRYARAETGESIGALTGRLAKICLFLRHFRSTERLEVILLHHPLDSLVVDTSCDRHPSVAIARMYLHQGFNLTPKLIILARKFPRIVQAAPRDP